MRLPKYRLHKASGRAVLQFKPLYGDRRIYLDGQFGSPESKAHYKRLLGEIARHIGQPESMRRSAPANAKVGALVNAFLDHAQAHYGPDSKEYGHYRIVAKLLYRDAASLPCADFGPLRLESVREQMIDRGWSRQHTNHQVNRLRRIFRWGVSREIAAESTWAALKTLDGLQRGKTRAPEAEAVRPVSRAAVELVLPFLSPTIRAMVEVQWLTGMRSDELVEISPTFLSPAGDSLVYEPTDHKNAWRGARKIVVIGPQARRWLEPYLRGAQAAPIFSPDAAMREIAQARRTNRQTKAYGKAAATKPQVRPLADRYTSHSYQAAINHGFRKLARSILLPRRPPDVSPREWSKQCRQPKGVTLKQWLASLDIEYWHPHQLRHTRATLTRAAYGVEGSQAQLGNSLEATELYAERSLALALRIAQETG